MLRRLRIGTRLACIALSCGLPMTAALVYVVLGGVQKDIEFGADELRGTRYQRPLFDLLVTLARRLAFLWMRRASKPFVSVGTRKPCTTPSCPPTFAQTSAT